MKTLIIGTITVALLTLSACSRRDPEPPGAATLDFEVPGAWQEPAGEGAPRAWLNEIGSVHLAQLVLESWDRSPDLKAMAATIDQAAAQVALAGSRAGLQVNAAGGVGSGCSTWID